MTDRDEEHEGSGGELRPEDVDRRFNEMIRDLGDDDAEPAPVAPAGPPPKEDEEEPTLLELWDAELPEDEDEDEEDYVAPEPPPLPWPSLPAVGGVLCVIGGVVLLVRPDIAPLGTNPGRVLGFLVFLVGVWLLISRLREDGEDDDPGNGAVV